MNHPTHTVGAYKRTERRGHHLLEPWIADVGEAGGDGLGRVFLAEQHPSMSTGGVLPGKDYFRTTSEMVWVTVSASVLPPYVTTTG